MQNIQEVFNQIQVVKKQQRDLRTAYKDALAASTEHKELTEQIKALKEKKLHIEQAVKEEFAAELDKLDDLKIEMETQTMMLNDIALTTIMNGETIELVDAYNNAYEPIFSVKFKKTNMIKSEDGGGETRPVKEAAPVGDSLPISRGLDF